MGSAHVMLLVFSACVYGSFSSCSDGHNDVLEGLIGQNVNLSCDYAGTCDSTRIIWRNYTSSPSKDISRLATPHTAVMDSQERKSFLRISGITFDDDGSYQCRCKEADRLRYSSPICLIRLVTICQTQVLLNGVTKVFKSNLTSSHEHTIDVTEDDHIIIECQESAKLKTDCSRSNEQPLPTSVAIVIPPKDRCLLECRVFSERPSECLVTIWLRTRRDLVSTISTSTHLQRQQSDVGNHQSKNSPTSLLIPLVLISSIAISLILAIIGLILHHFGIFNRRQSSNSSNLAIQFCHKSTSRKEVDLNENEEGMTQAEESFNSVISVGAQHIRSTEIDPIGEPEIYLYEVVAERDEQKDDEGIVIVDISGKSPENNIIKSKTYSSEDKYCYY